MPTDNPSVTRAAFGCLITLASICIPIAAGFATPGPWWAGLLVGLALTVVTFVLGAVALRPLLRMTEAEPYPIPTPGPDDPVHYVDYARRNDGCLIVGRHPPHRYYWRSHMPYSDGDGLPSSVEMSGSRWCTGRGLT